MPAQRAKTTAAVGIPQANRLVITAAGQNFPVRAKDAGPNPIGMP